MTLNYFLVMIRISSTVKKPMAHGNHKSGKTSHKTQIYSILKSAEFCISVASSQAKPTRIIEIFSIP
jgi:hypothetical protein